MKWTLGPRSQQKVPLSTLFLFVVCRGGALREKGEKEDYRTFDTERLIQLHDLLCMAYFYRGQLPASAPAGPGTRLRMCAAAGSSKLSSRSSIVNDDSPLVLSPPPPPFSPLPPDALRSCPCPDSGCRSTRRTDSPLPSPSSSSRPKLLRRLSVGDPGILETGEKTPTPASRAAPSSSSMKYVDGCASVPAGVVSMVAVVAGSAMAPPAAERGEAPSPWDGDVAVTGMVPKSAIVGSDLDGSGWANEDLWVVDAVGSPSVRAIT